jgi:hypothetical protein
MKKVILFLVLLLTLSVIIGLAGCGGSPTTPSLTYTVGDTGPAGGLIFYDKGSYSDGWRYLEAAPASTEWENKPWGSFDADFIGETEMEIGTGQSNTTTIVTWLNSHSETGKAAQLCDALVYGGYSDWFLPSTIPTLGHSTSAMASRATTVRVATTYMSVLFELFNYLSI